MLRKDHRIMIEQDNSWTIIKLMDEDETRDPTNGSFSTVSGKWKHTNESYNDQEIKFTSANPIHCYWEWYGAHIGIAKIGVKMGRASHKEDEKEIFQVLITLFSVRRSATGKFEVASVVDTDGMGDLTYNVNPHFYKGGIAWNPTRYSHIPG